LKKPNEN